MSDIMDITYMGVIIIIIDIRKEFVKNIDFGNRIELNKSSNWANRYAIIVKLIKFGTGKYLEENNDKLNDVYIVYKNTKNRYVKISIDKVLRNIYIDTEIPEDLFIIYSYLLDNNIII